MPAEQQNPASDEERKELALVAAKIVDAPEIGAADTDRFFGQVRVIAERRAQADWPNEGDAPFAVFVRADYPRAAAGQLQESRACADLGATAEPILGRIHILNFDASHGRSASLHSNSAGEVVEWLAEQKFASNQIIMLYRESLQLIERADGAEGGTTRQEQIRSKPPEVTEEELFEALDLFHRREVLTPSMCPPLWHQARNYHPAARPEKTIQEKLKTWLGSWWRGFLRAECEDSIGIGRIDIRLSRPDAGHVVGLRYWAIIELKVVKSFRHSKTGGPPATVSDNENATEVAKGVEQAADFAKDRGVFGVLEIYDMRRKKVPDPRDHALVVQALKDHQPNPKMRLLPLYGSADDARHADHAA